MAAKSTIWDIEVEGIPYRIEFVKNQIIINNHEPLKLGKLKRSGNSFTEMKYEVPIGSQVAVLHIRQFAEPALSFRGRDCKTGEEYIPFKIPGWAWIFVVLHALNFALFIGGAVGGALQAFVISLIIAVSANPKNKMAKRVWACVGIWLLSTIAQAIFAFWYIFNFYI